MAQASRILQVNAARANHDTVEGETLVLDPTSGVLTLLTGLGPVIWERLVVGAEPDALVGELTDRYGEDATAAVVAFLDDLVGAGLVVEVTGLDVVEAGAPSPWPDTYEPPGTERFDDIADIMTMDPIHEVDPSLGWPHVGSDPARRPE
jgi:hypothetical protein